MLSDCIIGGIIGRESVELSAALELRGRGVHAGTSISRVEKHQGTRLAVTARPGTVQISYSSRRVKGEY
jgi:hypothetical protein